MTMPPRLTWFELLPWVLLVTGLALLPLALDGGRPLSGPRTPARSVPPASSLPGPLRSEGGPGSEGARARPAEVAEALSFRVLGEEASPLPGGTILPADGALRTSSGPLRLAGPAGIRIDLQDARFRLTPVGITLEEGRSELLIPQAGPVFTVITTVAVLGVQGAGPRDGTRFRVVVRADGATQAAVQAGGVELSSGSGETRMLGPGDLLTANADGTLDAPVPAPASGNRGPTPGRAPSDTPSGEDTGTNGG